MQKKLEDALTWAVVAAIAVLCAAVVIGVFAKYQDCEEVGGVLVRGVFGYECVSR